MTFFVAGFPRCGTTWIYKAIKDHPQIFLPSRKQTYFFDTNYDKGIDWYLEHFADASPAHVAVGEIATQYTLPHALPRLVKHFPHVQILLAVRDPVERALSYYTSRASQHGWTSFREACDARPEIIEQGKYIVHIERLVEHYDHDRLTLLFHDDLKADDRAYLRQVLNCLGVDPDYESPQFGRVVQVSAFPRLRSLLRRMHMGPIMDRVSDSVLGDMIRKRLKSTKFRTHPKIDEATRDSLKETYRPFNERLERYAGRDLSHWM